MTPSQWVPAVVAGLVLAAVPFLRYAPLGAVGESHMNHEPRHGGQLGMVDNHHIELVRRQGRIEVYVSDAWRRPIRPARAWAAFDRSHKKPLEWSDARLVGEDEPEGTVVETVVSLDDGTRLALSFDLSEP